MSKDQWKEIQRCVNPVEAEIIRGLLEAQDIEVWLAQEGAGRAIGLSFTPMGEVSVLVPTSQVELAMRILESYEQGELEDESMDTQSPTNPED